MPRLALINPPFAAVHYPSIQLGIIQSYAERRGVATSTIYANLIFHKIIGPKLYNLISDHRGFQVGDWLFSRAAFGVDSPDGLCDDYLNSIERLCCDAKVSIEYLESLRTKIIPSLVGDVADQIVRLEPEVIGISSTFEQTVSGLAIAQSVKDKRKDIKVVFGGANFDDDMGRAHFESFPFIDVVVSGEFEPAANQLFSLLGFSDAPFLRSDSIHHRLDEPADTSETAVVDTGNGIEYLVPSYADYFKQLREIGLERSQMKAPIVIPFESSRGCWWGEKNHCTFCGLNGSSMKFRQRDASGVAEELAEQQRRFGVSRFAAVDNIIGPKFFKDFCEIVERSEAAWKIFYEVKANLSVDQIREFARAGIYSVQPGIESLSTPILKLMKKGIRGIQNVNTLKWCYYFGVQCSWNLLYGFPGEQSSYYDDQLRVLSAIPHLPPPAGGGRIWLERFSPYFDGRAEGFSDICYEKSLDYVYPAHIDKARISYFFTGKAQPTISDEDYRETQSWLDGWRRRWQADVVPYLYYSGLSGEIRIVDGRDDIHAPRILRYKEPIGTLLRFCGDRPRSSDSVREFLARETGTRFSFQEVTDVLDRLVERRLVIEEDGAYLFLALPLSAHRRTTRYQEMSVAVRPSGLGGATGAEG